MKAAFELIGKFLKWISLALLMVVVFIIACWRLIPDEDLRPEAQQLLAREISVPPEQNLDVALWGFEASPEREVIAVGKEIIAAISRLEPHRVGDDAPFEYAAMLGNKPLRFATSRKYSCSEMTTNCVAALRAADAGLQKEAIEYGVYVDRYRQLRNYSQLAETVPKSLLAPIHRWSDLLRISELVDAQIVRDAATPQTRANAVSELAAEIALWRRVTLQADLLITKMIGVAALQRKMRLASELLAEYQDIAMKNEAMVAAISAPWLLEDVSMRRVLDGEFRYSAASFLSGDKDLIKNEIKAGGDWVGKAVFSLGGYKHKATINRAYAHLYQAGEFYSQPSNVVVANEASLRAKNDSFDMFSPGVILYNPIGKVLLGVANTSWGDYAYRMHDLMAYSRLLELQRRIAVQKISREQIPAFLAVADKDLADPYTNQPMHWDAASGKLSFTAHSEKFRKGGNAITLY